MPAETTYSHARTILLLFARRRSRRASQLSSTGAEPRMSC